MPLRSSLRLSCFGVPGADVPSLERLSVSMSPQMEWKHVSKGSSPWPSHPESQLFLTGSSCVERMLRLYLELLGKGASRLARFARGRDGASCVCLLCGPVSSFPAGEWFTRLLFRRRCCRETQSHHTRWLQTHPTICKNLFVRK